jgi:dATP pyrophosphohydrolase
MIPVVSTFVAVAVVRSGSAGPEVLLLQRSEQAGFGGCWGLVTGSLEAGEDALQAAVRELAEETGLEAERIYGGNICLEFYAHGRGRIEIAPVLVAYVSAGAKVVLDHESTAYGWYSYPEALARVSFPGQRRILRFLHEDFCWADPPLFLRLWPTTGISEP